MSVPVLPQYDPRPNARMTALSEAREHYVFAFDKYPSLAMSSALPKAEGIPTAWSTLVFGIVKDVVVNDRRADKVLADPADARPARLADLRVAWKTLFGGGLAESANDLVALLLAGPVAGRAEAVGDYAKLFQSLPVPALASTFLEDAFFSRKVVCGSNPEILVRAMGIHPDFHLNDAHIAAASPGDTLTRAVQEGRLFIADYEMLADLEPNTMGGPKRWVHAPRVAYVVRPGTNTPSVFAIQVGRGAGAPVFTPADGWGWAIAKTHASVADTIAGAIWFHHARTHLVAEPMFVSAHRQLAPNHPVLRLLTPHSEGTLYINSVGHDTVFAPHGILDWFTGASRESVRELARRSVETFDFDASYFPRRLRARGVDGDSALGDFPWRDDGLLVFEALRAWVEAYIGLYYRDDADVLGDVELQAWLTEMVAPDGGGLQGLGQGGAFRTRGYLVDTLTQAIFSGSALHAAMNFPVKDEMAFVPNSPFAAYGEAPDRVSGWTEADYLAVLPPMDQAQRQMDVAWLLGAARYGELGDYPADHFEDPRVAPLLSALRVSLAAVEATIDARNTTRPPYIHLKPSRIPPSINI
jgi:arachidonate 15-lipoxygenase